MTRSLPIKLIGEIITVEFNFLGEMEWGEVLESSTVSVEVFAGLDFSPEDILAGSSEFGDSTVTQTVQAGLPGVIYSLIATAVGSSGNTYVQIRKLAVLSENGAFQPGRGLQLLGTLPDGRVGVLYSEELSIVAGFPPYEFDDIISGISPPWMAFNVVEDKLVCSGTPDESTATIYTFNPQVRDAVNNLANDPQVLSINTMVLSGDVPDGILAQAVSGSYTQVGGTNPVTYSVYSGTFPSGVTLNSDGTYSGEFTASANFSWVVKGVDANGVIAYLNDSSAVSQPEFMVVGARTSGISAVCRSTDTVTWSSKDFTGGNTYIFRDTATPNTNIVVGVNTGKISQNDSVSYSTCTGLSNNTICDGVYSGGIWMIYAYPDLNRSTNGGTSYSHTQPFSDGTYFICGAAVGNFALAAGNSSAWSSDRGATWHGSHNFVFDGGVYVAGAMATDGADFIVSANKSGGSKLYLYDGLNSWTGITSPFPSAQIQALAWDFIKNRLGVCSGNDFAYSDNFGSSWTVVSNIIPSGMTASPKGLAGCSGLWVVSCNDSSNHRIYSSLDGGDTWTRRTSGFTLNTLSRGVNMTVVPP